MPELAQVGNPTTSNFHANYTHHQVCLINRNTHGVGVPARSILKSSPGGGLPRPFNSDIAKCTLSGLTG